MAFIVKILGRSTNNYEQGKPADFELVDLLRVLSEFDYRQVIGYDWVITELDVAIYGDKGGFGPEVLGELFPELAPQTTVAVRVSGERFLERAALIHYIESGFFCRCSSMELPVEIQRGYKLAGGPAAFQVANVNMEIRRDEVMPYELVTEDSALVEKLKYRFKFIEVSGGPTEK